MSDNIIKFERPRRQTAREDGGASVASSNVEFVSQEARNAYARKRYYSGDISIDEYMDIVHGHEVCPGCGGHSDHH